MDWFNRTRVYSDWLGGAVADETQQEVKEYWFPMLMIVFIISLVFGSILLANHLLL